MKIGFLLPLVALVLIAVVAFALAKAKSKGAGRTATDDDLKKGRFDKRAFMTRNEQPMYWRLTEAFALPDFCVFAQVSFGALLSAKEGAARGSFSQKMADFVLCDKSMTVIAVIELDDSSHKGKEAADQARDAMLVQAGYKVLRYTRIPDVAQLRADAYPPQPAIPLNSPK